MINEERDLAQVLLKNKISIAIAEFPELTHSEVISVLLDMAKQPTEWLVANDRYKIKDGVAIYHVPNPG